MVSTVLALCNQMLRCFATSVRGGLLMQVELCIRIAQNTMMIYADTLSTQDARQEIHMM